MEILSLRYRIGLATETAARACSSETPVVVITRCAFDSVIPPPAMIAIEIHIDLIVWVRPG